MGVLLGLAAAFGWGTADLIARGFTRRIGSYRTLLYVQIVGAIMVGGYVLLSGEIVRIAAQSEWIIWLGAIAISLVGMMGSLMLYRAFSVGVLSIVSPIAASYAAVTVVLALLGGEVLTPLRLVGILLSILGVIAASIERPPADETQPRSRRLPPGVGLAICTAFIYGFVFWFTGFFIVPELGGLVPVAVTRMTNASVLLLFALLVRRSVALPEGNSRYVLIMVGIIDTLAFVASTLGVLSDQISVVTVLSSLFSAWTVILAAIFLHERLRWWQWLGIVTIFVGVALLSI